MMAINQVCHERQLPIDIVLEAVEVALASAFKRNFGGNQSVTAQIDSRSGEAHIYVEKAVVEQVENDKREISLEAARKINPKIEPGNLVSIESTPKDFGRIAAQTAKQVILQRIREAERDALYAAFAEREGEIVSGTVHKVDHNQVTLSLGKAEGVLPKSEQIATEHYKEGQRLRSYVAAVNKTSRGPQIILSRTHRDMLRRLLEVEVPEIYNGTVEIKSIAREAGHRSKVAVAALQEGVDPVGSCVGMRGTRIQNIVNELNGEKIDVVQWNPDLSYFIANSLSPAKVMNVMLNDDSGKTAAVVVPDKQLSLAIGKEGQNARLAAKLTGWRIDIKSASEAAEEAIERVKTQPAVRERMSVEKLNLFNLAASILHEKPASELSDGELNLLSEAIEAVNLAQMALERQRREVAEAARREARSRDILAEAEAILTGGQPIVRVEEDEAVAEVEVAAEAEPITEEVSLEATPVTPAVEVEELEAEVEAEPAAMVTAQVADDILAEAEALLADHHREEEVEAELLEVAEAEAEPVEAEAEAELVEVETTPVPVLEPSLPRPSDWSEESEEFDPEEDKRLKELEKKKAKQKSRRLVFDERLGEVIAERRRKRSRRSDDWMDFDGENEE